MRTMTNIAISGQGLGSATNFFPKWFTKLFVRQVSTWLVNAQFHSHVEIIKVQGSQNAVPKYNHAFRQKSFFLFLQMINQWDSHKIPASCQTEISVLPLASF